MGVWCIHRKPKNLKLAFVSSCPWDDLVCRSCRCHVYKLFSLQLGEISSFISTFLGWESGSTWNGMRESRDIPVDYCILSVAGTSWGANTQKTTWPTKGEQKQGHYKGKGRYSEGLGIRDLLWQLVYKKTRVHLEWCLNRSPFPMKTWTICRKSQRYSFSKGFYWLPGPFYWGQLKITKQWVLLGPKVVLNPSLLSLNEIPLQEACGKARHYKENKGFPVHANMETGGIFGTFPSLFSADHSQ